MANTKTLVVNENDIHLTFIDSGAPAKTPYVTIFAVHGMCFTGLIFKKVSKIFYDKGFRFVAVNRRNFGGSSPYTPEELKELTGGDDEKKNAWLRLRGQEFGLFIAKFIQQNNLPPITPDGKSGGAVILGWSAGASLAIATLSIVDTLPQDARGLLSAHIRAFIGQEPAPLALGLPTPPKNWAPLRETSIPEELRFQAFAHWITSYFEHGDFSKRDLDSLEYVLASPLRPPSIYNMTKAETDEMLQLDQAATSDLPFLFNLANPLKAAFRKVCFDPATKELLPKMSIAFMTGTMPPAFGPAGLWAVEREQKEAGTNHIQLKVIPGANHFMHWDDPEKSVEAYLDCIKL
ncbi:Alpha/Beta hydrolase protein [Lentinula raphanica]|uniref:Alpha/Beta hydrolase protein n=1 Tax=Lentinula raphanica TaxID=153919 RepID=A0AA38PCS7_9AGAR|nr:Alpha/Beta hydrolase protein [Lentinula raphanica]KAJ3840533.1 Alpha/Beta hydrolase protein [Lentinula raphanica]KAJ3972752.1 Alpha/Beta hydrolase protein [Lentinula raphanica]